MDLVDYLRVLRRRWPVIAVCVVVAVVAAWLTTPAEQPQKALPVGTSYRATHTLLQAADSRTPVNLELTRLFATTGEIPRRTAVRLGRPPEQGPVLASQVTVTPNAEVGSLAITVTGSDGPEAAAIANAFAVEIVENLRATAQRDRQAEQAAASRLVDSLGDRIAQLESRISAGAAGSALLQAQRDAYLENYATAFSRLQAVTSEGAARSPLVTLEQATPVPVIASSVFTPPSSRSARMLLAAALGLLLGVLLALVLERVDRRLRSREAVEDVTSLPVVAEVPVLPRRARRDWSIQAVTAPASAAAEAYRSLRSAVMLVPSRPALQAHGPEVEWKTPQVLLVTSPLPADGKSTTAVNLAACLAESGRRVLLLDCDFRNPTLHRYLDVQPGGGMSDLLAGTSGAELEHVVRTTAVPGVQLVTSGTATGHPAALLARAGGLLDAARGVADVVVIDAAPVLVANDATDLVPYVDAVILVARSGRTTSDHALRTTELLARLSVPIAGTVLVGSSGAVRGYSSRLPGLFGLRRRWSAAEPPRAWSTGDAARSRHSRRSGPRPQRAEAVGLDEAPERQLQDIPTGTGWPPVQAGPRRLSSAGLLDPGAATGAVSTTEAGGAAAGTPAAPGGASRPGAAGTRPDDGAHHVTREHHQEEQ